MAEVEWEIELARSGVETLSLARRHAHSAYDPLREAQQIADRVVGEARQAGCDALITIGTGLGYITRAIAENWGGEILHWEPFPQLAAELGARGFPTKFRSADRRASQKHAKRTNHAGRNPERDARRILHATTTGEFDAAIDALATDGRQPTIWVHPGYEHVCRFETRYALRALRRHFVGHHANLERNTAVVSRRSLEAMSPLPFTPVIDDLSGCLEGQTAIISSAGPSLRTALPLLRQHQGGVRFACVQVLNLLASAGAQVHFAVSADLRDLFEVFGIANDVAYDVLLADSSSPPKMLRNHASRSCLYHQRTPHIHQLAWQDCGLEILDEPTVSVSETALLLAHRLGARRFILLGVDLDSADARYRERFEARNHAGESVSTNSHYFHASRYLSDYCSRLAAEGCEFFRLGDGLRIDGCRPIDTKQLDALLAPLPRYLTPDLPRGPRPDRLAATRRLYRWLANRESSSTQRTCESNSSGRPDSYWEPLEPARSRRLAKEALKSLLRRDDALLHTV